MNNYDAVRQPSHKENHNKCTNYNELSIDDFISKLKAPGTKGFKILRELNEQQINLFNQKAVSYLNRVCAKRTSVRHYKQRKIRKSTLRV